MDNSFMLILIAVAAGAVTGLAFFMIYRNTLKSQKESIEKEKKQLMEDAKREAEAMKKESAIHAKDLAYQAKVEAEKEIRERTRELNQLDKRLRQKEEQLEKRTDQLERKEHEYNKREREHHARERSLSEKENQYSNLIKEQTLMLERISGITSEDAKQELLKRVAEDTKFEAAKLAKKIEDEAKENAEKKAKEVISFAIQRYSSDYVADATVSAVSLPGDDMKGRIIGREGRNIRAFEAATGVDLVVDDTPELVTLSAHDPVRREIARIALERLVADGRIHPTRIEEVVEKVKKEVDGTIREEGEKAVFDLGISGIHPELIKTIGRLKYRTSYGQNILQHSKEVAYLAGMMAGELGVDIKLAKRAGLLHDIGKAVDHEIEGSHQEIGANLAKKYGENDYVINAIMAHHGDVDPSCVESALVAAGDALSAARPGVRRESIENYLKRLTKLEELAMSFNGVDKCYAIQAGREIRIIVKPDDVNDDMCAVISKDLARKIETEMTYPGQIKVAVIRESRHVDYAK
ncbi:MAG: ribonuclease Y [Nitrospirae bacterium GWC2_46_6]|nr:MAG: ribonuclease Y [Nitrospirae bacterium GWC2_46_6]OGW24196.1 MAG: ribonuclease Y [Nitrospirae bacterium GWB2_47_37]HAK89694.1 ribonuclease Y [Nitrospiraceae bacterium]HCL82225.1 ribonuclease Y [Nitrospiraceae bacterium]